MVRWMATGCSAVTATFLSGSAALADISAQDVWDDFSRFIDALGYTVETAGEEMSGDTLIVSDFAATSVVPMENGNSAVIAVAIGEIAFQEFDNGSVRIGLPDSYTMTIGDEKGEGLDLEIQISHANEEIFVSGDPDNATYSVSMPELELRSTRFNMEGEPVDAVMLAVMKGYEFEYVTKRPLGSEITEMAGIGSLADLAINFDLNVPEEDVAMAFDMAASNLVTDIALSLPESFDAENLAASIDAGYAANGGYGIGPMTFSMSGTGEGDSFAMDATASGGVVDFEIDAEGVALSESINELDVTVSGSSIPFPQLVARAAEMGFNFRMPVMESENPQEFAFGLNIVELAIPEELWGMFDQAGTLPRDPATLVVETSGTANWFFDIMDPAVQSQMQQQPMTPGEVHTLVLQNLLFDALGTQLTGTGNFTFDNDDLTTFDGMPRPEGQVDLKLVGANTLLDKLVEMGVFPEEQAMGARMMMGLFAVPGEGEDTLNSTIVINEQGHVLANGQRLQ